VDAAQVASNPDWLAVVRRLDTARSAALVDRDAGMLREVYAAHAAARTADSEQITAMRTRGYHLRGAAHRVKSATPVHAADHGPVTVRVVEALPSYEVYGDDGAVVGRTTGEGAQTVVMHLVPQAGGFRIRRVVPG
jgi:hypothetical protein